MENLTQNKRKWYELDSAILHVLAMLFMLCDHTWSTLLPNQQWLTCIGRLAFPIFAFMLVEGYFHTHDLKKYMCRMLISALISEIPFNLMYNGTIIYPFHQNVMWTFLIALSGMWLLDKVKQKKKLWIVIPLSALIVIAYVLLGFVTFVDYYGTGIMMVFTFYFFRNRKWWCYLGQFAVMYWLNVEILGGYYYPVKLFGHEFELIQQGIALLSLIPIWLYQGRQGHHSKAFKYFCYAFYPTHMLILYLIGFIMSR